MIDLGLHDPQLPGAAHHQDPVQAQHRIEAERFHRASSLLHGEAVGADCTPLLEGHPTRQVPTVQAPLSADFLCSLNSEHRVDPALRRKRSERSFAASTLREDSVFEFLDAAYCGSVDGGRAAAPSAGGCYPVHILFTPLAPISGGRLRAGDIVHVDFLGRSLYRLRSASPESLFRACMGCDPTSEDAAFRNVAFMVAYALDLDRGTERYGVRGYRFALIECGAMTQQASYSANAQGWGSCLFGGYADNHFAQTLGLRPQKMALLCVQLFGNTTPAGVKA